MQINLFIFFAFMRIYLFFYIHFSHPRDYLYEEYLEMPEWNTGVLERDSGAVANESFLCAKNASFSLCVCEAAREREGESDG
jgi:hypothetical protein